jgi:hypothetical protein
MSAEDAVTPMRQAVAAAQHPAGKEGRRDGLLWQKSSDFRQLRGPTRFFALAS